MRQKLSLGTVQFGLNYGVSNKSGKISNSEIEFILDYASENGISELDTAVAYGDSESIVGRFAKGRFHISTKLPKIDSEIQNEIGEWTKFQIESSLKRLNVEVIDTLFLHDVSILFGPYASEVYNIIEDFRTKGYINKFGLSIYSYHDLEKIPNYINYHRIQCPINIIDRTLQHSGWMEKLIQKNIEIQARSIFLQGVLLMEGKDRPKYFLKWQDIFDTWENTLQLNQVSSTLACILYIKSLREVTNVVFGVESKLQLQEIVNFFNEDKVLKLIEGLSSDDEDLIFPYRWKIT